MPRWRVSVTEFMTGAARAARMTAEVAAREAYETELAKGNNDG